MTEEVSHGTVDCGRAALARVRRHARRAGHAARPDAARGEARRVGIRCGLLRRRVDRVRGTGARLRHPPLRGARGTRVRDSRSGARRARDRRRGRARARGCVVCGIPSLRVRARRGAIAPAARSGAHHAASVLRRHRNGRGRARVAGVTAGRLGVLRRARAAVVRGRVAPGPQATGAARPGLRGIPGRHIRGPVRGRRGRPPGPRARRPAVARVGGERCRRARARPCARRDLRRRRLRG